MLPVVVGRIDWSVNSLDPPDATAFPSNSTKPEHAGRMTPLKQTPGCCAERLAGIEARIAATRAVVLVFALMRRRACTLRSERFGTLRLWRSPEHIKSRTRPRR